MSRLIILTYDYPPNNGGIARLCFEIKKQYNLHHLPVEVVCLANQGKDPANDQNVVRVTSKRGKAEYELLQYIRKHTTKDDIILTGTFHPDGLIALLSGRRTYILAHGAELLPGHSVFRKHLWKYYRNRVLKKAHAVIANSHYTASLVKTCSPEANVLTLPLGVDITYFHPTLPKKQNGKLNLCSISRLEAFKGHDFIIRTLSMLPAAYRNKIHLTIGGKGPYKETLEKMVTDLQVTDQVSFTGFVADDKLCDFYSSADIFILCTREEPGNRNVEGFGLVFTEAQACGTAVIGTKAGGIPDAVHDGNGGWLIEPDNQKQLTALLKKTG
ncbi:MAG: glycosyltransferase family 4 protein [Tannerellaceae bacterium]|nr:glycosyltransferase family 4 protein [Tannerellaceae bacterium]